MSDLASFLVAAAVILATPGPTNALMATAGAGSGIGRSLHLLLAALLAYVLAIYAVRFVAGPILAQSPALGITLKVAVALYLLYLATKLWRRPIAIDGMVAAISFSNVFATTLLNPKALVLALTVFPPEPDLLVSRTIVFSLLVVAAGGGWIAIGAAVKRLSGHRAGYIPRVASLVLVGFAGFLLRAAVLAT
jgi:threonine/homoserine/homoserine lactone efflux protein